MDEVIAFWLSHRDRWWSKDAGFDEEIRARFGALRIAVLAGERDEWLETARGTLAYVIVLDQFSRNLFRTDSRAFEGDTKALGASRVAIARGDDAGLSLDERQFLYMPFMHSENSSDQDRSVDLFRALGEPGGIRSAEQHRDVIRRFGRFPGRNALIGRASTAEEIAFSSDPKLAYA